MDVIRATSRRDRESLACNELDLETACEHNEEMRIRQQSVSS